MYIEGVESLDSGSGGGLLKSSSILSADARASEEDSIGFASSLGSVFCMDMCVCSYGSVIICFKYGHRTDMIARWAGIVSGPTLKKTSVY